MVDSVFQYEPNKPAGVKGGTINPVQRRVLVNDIQDLKISSLKFNGRFALLGAFTNIYHHPFH